MISIKKWSLITTIQQVCLSTCFSCSKIRKEYLKPNRQINFEALSLDFDIIFFLFSPPLRKLLFMIPTVLKIYVLMETMHFRNATWRMIIPQCSTQHAR